MKAICLSVAVATAMAISQSPAAAKQSLQDDDVASALDSRLAQTFKGEPWTHHDAARFVAEFYTPDAVGTMQGAATAWRGTSALTGLMTGVMQTYQSVDYHIDSTHTMSRDAAYQFVVLDAVPVDATKPHDMLKCLYVWQKLSAGWRVAADMCSAGDLEKAK